MTATIPTVLGQVTVRYLQDADHVAYVNLEKDVEVKRYVNGPSPRSDQDLRDSLRAERPSQGMLAIADTSNDQFIGRCGLLPSKTGNETEVFCLLTKSHWRRGIGELVVPFLVQLASAKASSTNYFYKLHRTR